MVTQRGRVEVAVIVFLLIGVVFDSALAGRSLISSDNSTDVEFTKPPKGTVKTIKNGKSGDIVDCVDIYKQPALDHPLLKIHTLQMKPSWLLEDEEDGNDKKWLQAKAKWEDWGVDCPEGTVPITRRRSKHGPLVKDPSYSKGFSNISTNDNRERHEYAQVSLYGAASQYHGARANLNLWQPYAELGEVSISQIWIVAGPSDSLNTIEAGWITGLDNVRQPRLFTYWTSDGYRSTGCYNLQCPGFVQTHGGFELGQILHPASTYGGDQRQIHIEITQDKSNGNWWLEVEHLNVGYWPEALFNRLRYGAGVISWGGEIYNLGSGGYHTTTQMGSGHFPRDGYYTKSAFISDIGHIQETGRMRSTPAGDLSPLVTKPHCYDLVTGPTRTNLRTHVYFGGPGRSAQCPV